MKSFMVGVVFGIVISTVGFSGLAKIVDNSLNQVKERSVEMAK